jgi:hypothetical protein
LINFLDSIFQFILIDEESFLNFIQIIFKSIRH